jgi:hypothetical protein
MPPRADRVFIVPGLKPGLIHESMDNIKYSFHTKTVDDMYAGVTEHSDLEDYFKKAHSLSKSLFDYISFYFDCESVHELYTVFELRQDIVKDQAPASRI